jgi:hypothetical protein
MGDQAEAFERAMREQGAGPGGDPDGGAFVAAEVTGILRTSVSVAAVAPCACGCGRPAGVYVSTQGHSGFAFMASAAQVRALLGAIRAEAAQVFGAGWESAGPPG